MTPAAGQKSRKNFLDSQKKLHTRPEALQSRLYSENRPKKNSKARNRKKEQDEMRRISPE
jgi:hypothetical protein